MKTLSFLCFLACLFLNFGLTIAAGPGFIKDPATLISSEIARLDTLIQATGQSLDGQMKLRDKIVEYQKIENLHLKQPEDNDILFKLIISAHRTLECIKANHLIQTFDPDFINELKVLSQAVSKRGIPKP